MNDVIDLTDSGASDRISGLFKDAPILMEVTFHGCGTSSDWYCCRTEDEFWEVIKRLPHGRELYLTSVWEIESRHTARLART